MWYVQFDLDGGAQMDAAWVSQATLVEEAAVVVPEVQRFPSMFAKLFNRPHHSSTTHHYENPKLSVHRIHISFNTLFGCEISYINP